MGRGLDHLVLVVDDLERARGVYERFGFTTTPRAVHPFGTENFLIQLQGSFLEILAVADREKIKPHGPRSFSFAWAAMDFLKHGEGMSALVFQSTDARADRADFLAAGLDASWENVDFSRGATLPDGNEVTVAFSLAFVTDPDMPQTVFFTCQQHAPEHFWKPAYQIHANGARRTAEAIMVAPDPAAHAGFFEGMHGPASVTIEPDGLLVRTAAGEISMMTDPAFLDRFGAEAPGALETARFAGFRIEVGDLGETEAVLRSAGVALRKMSGGLQAGPPDLPGFHIEFTPVV